MNKNILSYSAKWFVLIIIASIVLWSFVFGSITKPADTEKITLFLTAEASDEAKIKDKIALNGITTSVVSASETDKYYSAQFTTTALITADLIVMNADKMPTSHADMQFAPLNSALLDKFGIGERTFVTSEDTPYAIVVYDKQNGINLLNGLARFDENNVYCIAVNVTRPNAAPFSTADKTTDNAFVALSKLLAAK